MRHPRFTLPARAGFIPYAAAGVLAAAATGLRGQTVPADPAVPLPAVTVSADAAASGLSRPFPGGDVASGARIGVLGSEDLMDAPFSFTSYTQALIQDQQDESVGDVLMNDSSVRVARGFGNFQQVYQVRGLPIYSDDMAYNGLYGLLPRQYLATELIERVDLLRGANAFLNGAAPGGSGLGGAINIMPKRAEDDAESATFGIETGNQVYEALDVSRRFDHDAFGVRVNVADRNGDTAVGGEFTRLNLATVGADYTSGRLRVSADLGYQDHRDRDTQPSITIDPGLPIPATPAADRSVGQPWSFSNEKDVFGTLRAECDVTSWLTLWVAGGERSTAELATFANPTVFDAQGDMSSYRFDNARRDTIRTGEVGVRARFETGPLTHQVVASVTGYGSGSRNAYAFSSFAGFTTNLYQPTVVAEPAADFYVGGKLSEPLVTERIGTASEAVADVIGLDHDQWLLTVGARNQLIQDSTFDYNTGKPATAYSEAKATPVGGLVCKLDRNVSLYANYIQGMAEGGTAPATSGGRAVRNAGEALSPYITKQVEAGIKFENTRLGVDADVFRSDQPTAAVNPQGYFTPTPNQRTEGLEANVFGMLTPDIKLLGGASMLDTVTGSGLQAIGAPKFQSTLGAELFPPYAKGFTVDFRWIHTGSQFADQANTQEVPEWNRWDVGIRYTYESSGKLRVTMRLRMENVGGKNYWASAGGYPGAGYLTVGEPRILRFSVTLAY